MEGCKKEERERRGGEDGGRGRRERAQGKGGRQGVREARREGGRTVEGRRGGGEV